MKELKFTSYTHARLPSGTCFFFPSLEERCTDDGRSESATIVGYDHPPYSLGTQLGGSLQLALEESDFGRLERELKSRDLADAAFVIRYELGEHSEVIRVDIDRIMVGRSGVQGAPGQADVDATLQPPRGQRAKA
jgi:hypothetical protein